MEMAVLPILSGPERLRMVGIVSAESLVISRIYPNSPADAAGLREGDLVVALDGAPVYSRFFITDRIDAHPDRTYTLTFKRNGRASEVRLVPEMVVYTTDGDVTPSFGFRMRFEQWIKHVHPFTQLWDDLRLTFKTLAALMSRGSDVGLSKLSGPIGITNALYTLSFLDLRLFLGLIVLININLAILNLLPIPVLDGGHMAFATVAFIRGKARPPRLIAATQGIFMILLLGLMLYVSIFDVRRWSRNEREDLEFEQERERMITPVFRSGLRETDKDEVSDPGIDDGKG